MELKLNTTKGVLGKYIPLLEAHHAIVEMILKEADALHMGEIEEPEFLLELLEFFETMAHIGMANNKVIELLTSEAKLVMLTPAIDSDEGRN